MLKIEITNPLELDQKTLIATAKFLFELAGCEVGLRPECSDVSPPAPQPEPVKPVLPVETGIIAAVVESTITPPPVPQNKASETQASELDTDGMPWDARIHSRTKSKTAEGTWSLKRGVDLKLITEVTNELKGTPNLFGPLMLKITSAINNGTLTRDDITNTLKSLNIESLPTLSTRVDLIPQFEQALGL